MELLKTPLPDTTSGAFDPDRGPGAPRSDILALVLASVRASAEGVEGAAFLVRRTEQEIERANPSEQAAIRRLLRPVCPTMVPDLLVEYSSRLEDANLLADAEAVLVLADRLQPHRADLTLHQARVARRRGESARARSLYEAARRLDGTDGTISRLALIGEALVSSDPKQALSTAIRRAVRCGDSESAAVGLEERARLRRRTDRPGAARDLAIAAARFQDPTDRGRAALTLADLLSIGGDSAGAGEALKLVLSCGDTSQRQLARSRLYSIAAVHGDSLGMRRWRSPRGAPMVGLSGRPHARTGRSAAPRVARWRTRLERFVNAAGC
jgi:hypothetical protein